MAAIDADTSIGAIVLTGSERAFAAGADIKEMKDKQFADVYRDQFLGHWSKMNSVRKPIVGAVSGYAVRWRAPSLCLSGAETISPARLLWLIGTFTCAYSTSWAADASWP